MSAHPFGRPSSPTRDDHRVSPFMLVAAVAVLGTIVAVVALVVGVNIWGAR